MNILSNWRRIFLLASIIAVIATLCMGWLAYRHYEAVLSDFQRESAPELLLHPERVGIANIGEVVFRSVDGIQLGGWYVPSRNRAAVIVTHGTNSDRSSMLTEIRILAEAGFGVLAFDWPGDGESEGVPHWGTAERNALKAAVGWLASRPDLDSDKIGGLGFSMGGFVMAQGAAQDVRLRAVVLEAAPPDYAELIHWQNRRWGFLSEIPAEWGIRRSGIHVAELRPVDVVKKIAPRALLILGGTADSVVPEFMTRELFAAAVEPKTLWIVDGAGHGNYSSVAPVEYRTKLVEFFSRNLLGVAY